jgi:hypothetical protein
VIRKLLCLAIVITSFEAWARFRFAEQSLWLPMSLRANIAPTPLASRRLVPNYHGVSQWGQAIFTDAFGFRCAERFTVIHREAPSEALLPTGLQVETSKFKPTGLEPSQDKKNIEPFKTSSVVLAGDSIAFGMYLPFEDSWGFHLERHLRDKYVHVQAVPGGSQALTLDHLFGPDELMAQTKAPWLIHTVTNYDNTDNWLYDVDAHERQQFSTRFLRQLQSTLGPYWIQMLKVKARAFLKKDRRKNLLFAEAQPPTRQGATQRALEKLQQACLEQQVKLSIVFTPDRGELMSQGQPGAKVAELCQRLSLPFFDLCEALKFEASRPHSKLKLERVFRSDRIHFTPEGALWAGKLLARWFEESRP